MTPGDKVRLFDIGVPGPRSGGIFDRVSGSRAARAEQSLDLIGDLQRGYANHHGNTFPLWMLFLMAKDWSKRIIALADKFIDHVDARTDGWEVRFARKFGVIYAAMKLGVDSGVLPWSNSMPLKVATKCYRKAHGAAKGTNAEQIHGLDAAAASVHRLLNQHGRVVAAPSAGKTPTKVTRRTVAIRYVKDGRTRIGIFDDALLKLLGSRKAKATFTTALDKAGILPNGHGHAGTIQERIPIKRNGSIINRPHLWVIDAAHFSRLFKKYAEATHSARNG
jgi:hypothetical protein